MRNKKEIEYIKNTMIDSLELPIERMIDGKNRCVLSGDYVCHTDMLDNYDTPEQKHFVVCGEDDSHTYLVMIHKINL